MRAIVRTAMVAALTCAAAPAIASDETATLYVFVERTVNPVALRDGRFGPIATIQARLKELITPVDPALASQLVPDGIFGTTSARALRLVLTRPDFANYALSPGKPLRISVGLWQKLLANRPMPNPEARAMTLVLTYEATEFDKPAAWNFCQNPMAGADGKKVTRRAPCRTNDDSILTWGPRGATLAGGSEIRATLIALEQRNPGIVSASFGSEYPALQRALGLSATPPMKRGGGRTLRARENVSDLELFSCSIWLNSSRATQWSNAFAQLGSLQMVQSTYNELYTSTDFDGAKVAAFYRLYALLGIQASEIDHAFFLDRATHTSGVFVPGGTSPPNTGTTIDAAAKLIRSDVGTGQLANWKIRRAISRAMPPKRQVEDRNGRDVAYFVDGAGEAALTPGERANWKNRFALAASFAGLSDERSMPKFVPPKGSWETRQPATGALTASERGSFCEPWVVERTSL